MKPSSSFINYRQKGLSTHLSFPFGFYFSKSKDSISKDILVRINIHYLKTKSKYKRASFVQENMNLKVSNYTN